MLKPELRETRKLNLNPTKVLCTVLTRDVRSSFQYVNATCMQAMWAGLVIFLLSCYLLVRLSCGKTKSRKCLVGKTAIVTGGNAGIGYQVCLNLASRGCKVIIADKDDSEESRLKIIEYTGNANIVSKKLDLSSFKSIRDFASDIILSESKLDILVNNAGVSALPYQLTKDNLHPVMQVNHFGPFLLTHLLLGLLKKSAPSRIIFTSSFAAFTGNIDVDNFVVPKYKHQSKTLATIRHYCNTKLAAIMISDIFAKKLKGTGVTSNSLHPGWVRTGIFMKGYTAEPATWFVAFYFAIFGYYFGKSVWEGAETTTHLAVSKRMENVSGEYFWDCKPFPKPLQARNMEVANQLWSLSEKCVSLLENEKI